MLCSGSKKTVTVAIRFSRWSLTGEALEMDGRIVTVLTERE